MTENHFPIKSRNLRAASYEVWNTTLTIEFCSGAVYLYADVPPSVYDGLIVAESPGRYHNLHIKNNYPFRRLK